MFGMKIVCFICLFECLWSPGIASVAAQAEDWESYRVVGGSSPSEGVLQFRSSLNETWSTVCVSFPFVQDFGVDLCNRLGHRFFCTWSYVASKVAVNSSWLGDFPLKEAGISCELSEGGFWCGFDVWQDNDPICSLDQGIWIVCDSDLDVRLSPGGSENYGRLQVRCDNSHQWQGVCGDDWLTSTHAHKVACRQLGFPNASRASPYVVPGQLLKEPEDFLLGSVNCSGPEENLVDCWTGQFVDWLCDDYAGLKCGHDQQEGSLELSLADSHFAGSGVVVGRYGPTDSWGFLCGNEFSGGHWDTRDADVACRHLGFHSSIPFRVNDGLNTSAIPASPLPLEVGCYGYETNISQCQLVPGLNRTCQPPAYIECRVETERFHIPTYLCGEIHYCGYDCDSDRRNTRQRTPPVETCKCDDACFFFNDCCYDYRDNCNQAPDLNNVHINGVSVEHYACIWVPGFEELEKPRYTYFGFSLVSVCPDQWSDPFVRRDCQAVADDTDVISLLPVYDHKGASYKNIFCAVCHGVDPRNVQKWTALIYKKGEARYNESTSTIDIIQLPRYVFKPPTANGSFDEARTCPVKTIGTCGEDFVNTSMQAACDDYFAPMFVNGAMYKNPHCAMCNGLPVNPDRIYCEDPCNVHCSSEDNWVGCQYVCSEIEPPVTIEDLFDFNWGGGENSNCQAGQLFDPFLDRCRTVFCASGIKDETGECRFGSEALPVPSAPWFSLLGNGCNAIVNDSLGSDVLYWQALPTSYDKTLDINYEGFLLSLIVENVDSQTILENYTAEMHACNITTVKVYVREGASLLSEIDVCAKATMIASDVFHVTSRDNSSLDFNIFTSLTLTIGDSNLTRRIALPVKCLGVLYLDCTQVELFNDDEYVLQGSSIKHAKGTEFGPVEFVVLPDGKAAVCGPVDWSDPHKLAIGVVSLVCSCLSILSLVATFVTYCVFSKLRNPAGVYTMNLVVALFATFALLLAGNLKLKGHSCEALASFIHFSWLAAFFWMSTLSVNAAKTFGSKIIQPKGTHPSYRRLLTTMALVWGSALLIVSVCLVLNFCMCTSLPPIYSATPPCLITNAEVNLVVFGVPLATSLLLSMICFLYVILNVRKAKRDSKMAHKGGMMAEVLGEVKIYAKLTLLFGIAWVLSFVSSAVNHVIISYINVIVNTLQGVFLFVAFVLNASVQSLWRQKLCIKPGNKQFNNTASNSKTGVTNVTRAGSATVNAISDDTKL